ncbi:PE family protein, partial [Mycobacterium interjectum]|uniref:PE family protein n=1 Tax=Mycobacterium interjectum TaxID=33895 RepID=UPI0009FCAAE7
MSFVFAVPEMVSGAASDLANIGSTISTASATAAAPTTGMVASAADEVSASVAAFFSAHAAQYQAISAQVEAFHSQFVQAVASGAMSYAAAEAANASPLQALEQQLLAVVNTPTELLLGRPLIGNGANGAPGTGAPGGAGGILLGNGGSRG